MQTHFYRVRSGALYASHPDVRGFVNAQTGKAYPQLPASAMEVDARDFSRSAVDRLIELLAELRRVE